MTETTEAPRNDAGQFTPDTSNLFGAELANAEAGFKTRPRDPEPEEISSDADSLRQVAADRAAKHAQPIEIQPDDAKEIFGKPDVAEAVSPEQAAKDLASRRHETSKFIDGYNIERVAETIDAKRAEQLKANPRAADELGLSAEDVEAAKNVDKPETLKNQPAEMRSDPATPGLDPEVERALAHPQVRQAIEEELGRAETTKQSYQAALTTANQFAMASLVDHFPELGQIPVEKWEPALGILAEQDPQRFNRAMGVLERVSQLQSATTQWRQQQEQVQHQQFEATVVAEDARLTEMFGGDKAAADAANNATIAYLAEHGIPRNQMLQIFKTNPVLSTAEARKTIWEAQEYRKIKSAPKAVPQALPTVQRPGIQRDGPRPGDNSSKIAALQKQLASANGDKAAKIAGQIRSLKRSA